MTAIRAKQLRQEQPAVAGLHIIVQRQSARTTACFSFAVPRNADAEPQVCGVCAFVPVSCPCRWVLFL